MQCDPLKSNEKQPNYFSSCPKIAVAVLFTKRVTLFEALQNVVRHLGYFGKKIYLQDFSNSPSLFKQPKPFQISQAFSNSPSLFKQPKTFQNSRNVSQKPNLVTLLPVILNGAWTSRAVNVNNKVSGRGLVKLSQETVDPVGNIIKGTFSENYNSRF